MSVDRYGIALRAELQAVPPECLEEYVKARLLQFVGEPVFAKRMYQTVEGVQRAAKEVLTEISVPAGNSSQDGATGAYSLQFRHDCRSIGCLCPDCELCKQAQHRRCTSCFGNKYLSGDALKAKCGAPIIVEIINPQTGEVVSLDKVSDVQLEICVMDSRAYAALTPGLETPDELDACTLLVNSQGKELLSPGKNANYNEDHKIITPMHHNTAELQVHVAGSSIAMLQGQRPPFRLLVRATSARDGRRLDSIKPAVSDAFVVATQRVKTAQKAEIPHIDEPVSKIENVGVQTQNKLQDIKAAAEQIGVHGLNVVHNCITTVGQFKELVESSETDQPLQETLKKVLNFTSNGWQKAREHAMRAVSTDNRMRAWCADDSLEDGLLFKCYLGRVDLEAPVGILRRTSIEPASGTVSFDVSLLSDLNPQQKAVMSNLQEAARNAWWQPGHPGWCIPWDYDSTAFMRSLTESANVAQPAASPKMRISAPVPRSLQSTGLLQHLGNPLGVSLPHSLASSDTHLTRGYRSSLGTTGPSNPLANISAAQLLPNFQSLYNSSPGAMLGSGQAAHQALGSQTQSSLTANLNATNTQTHRYLAGLSMGQGSNTGAHVPDTEAYTGAFDFVAPRNPSDSGPRPLVQGSSLSRGFALPLQGAGGFKVNQVPTSPFEGGVRQQSGGAGSNSSGAGPFGQRIAHTQSMDTTSNSNHQSAEHAAGPRALGSTASQIQQEPSPRSRESPFEAYKQQHQPQHQQRVEQERERHIPQGLQRPAPSQQPSLGAWTFSHSGDKRPHSHISESPHQPGHPQPGHAQPPRQPSGLSQFQQHHIQQAYANLMQQPKQEEPPQRSPAQPQSEPNYPLQPVPSRLGPNSVLSLPSYGRMMPQLTTNDLDTIVKLRQQLSGENGLLTRLSSFMQAQRTTDHRQIPGHDSSESLRGEDKSGSHLAAVGSGQSVAALERPPHDPSVAAAVRDSRAQPSSANRDQMEVTQLEGRPVLAKSFSKVEGLLDELTDVLGAIEHIAPAEGDTPMPSRLTGQEINRNGLNGVHKSAFEPVTSAQNKRRKLTPHNSSESENNSQPHTHENIAEHEDEKV